MPIPSFDRISIGTDAVLGPSQIRTEQIPPVPAMSRNAATAHRPDRTGPTPTVRTGQQNASFGARQPDGHPALWTAVVGQ